MTPLHLMTIVGTRPEIIRLSAVIRCCDRYFRQTLVHTGQNWDYTLPRDLLFRTWACGHRTGSSMWSAPTGADPGERPLPVLPASSGAPAGRGPASGRHQLLPLSHLCQAAANSHLSHGGRKPLL